MPSVWVNLDGVVAASGLIHDLLDRTHIRCDRFRPIKLAEYRQQRRRGRAQRRGGIVDIKATHVSPEWIVTLLRPANIDPSLSIPFLVFGYGSSPGVFVPLVVCSR